MVCAARPPGAAATTAHERHVATIIWRGLRRIRRSLIGFLFVASAL
jgi:hypothetical protein